jgi:hypothetical protein
MDDVSDRIVQAGLDRLAALKAEKERIEEELSLLLKEIQSACGHPEKEIVEGEYRASRWEEEGAPPFRVCRRCGYSEPGWNCGYFRLYPDNHSIPHMARDAAWKFIRGGLMSQAEKDRLFRARWDREAAARRVEDVNEEIARLATAAGVQSNNG